MHVKHGIPLSVDVDAYSDLDAKEMLHLVTVREARLAAAEAPTAPLIGYALYILRPHLHYKETLHAYCDVYYLAKDGRKGLAGYRLLQYAEETLKKRGVQMLMSGTKASLDMSRLFERLGWSLSEQTFLKYLGEG